jgi:8-amino-7-oxononanoate synthase
MGAAALHARIAAAAATARARDRQRVLDTRAGAQGPQIEIDGRTYLNFTSNDYLGLAAHPAVVARVGAELGRHGYGSGGAALLGGRSTLHAEFERALASYLGMPAALVFSSGYLANLGAIAALIGARDTVLHDRLNHASLIDAVRASDGRHRRYAHADAAACADLVGQAQGDTTWVITESLFSMDGDVAPLAELERTCRAADAMLYIDDAHGMGVLADGRGGIGLCAPEQRARHVLMVTLGKSLGAHGAVVLAAHEVIEYLVQHARTFIYDTALPAVSIAAALAALAVLQREPDLPLRLAATVARFRTLAAQLGLPLSASTSPIQPLVIGADARAVQVATRLRAAGIYVRAIRPPTVPEGSARLRLTLTVNHREDDLVQLVEALVAALA